MELSKRPDELRIKTRLGESGYVRRVQVTGKGSYVVSIPKHWVETTGLKKGGRVEFNLQQDHGLLLKPFHMHGVSERSHCQISLDSDLNPETITRKIISLYVNGFSTINVTCKPGTLSPRIRNRIREVVRQKLVGTEMVTESSKSATLQVLLNYPQLLAPDALRRMGSIMKSMLQDAVKALVTNDKDLAFQVIHRDDEIDRFSLYIIRQLNWAIQHIPLLEKIGVRSPTECLSYRIITANLERSADHASRVAQNAVAFHRPLQQMLAVDVNALAQFSSDIMETALRAFHTSDYEAAESTFLESEKLITLTSRLMDNSSKKKMSARELAAFTLISESLRRIGERATDIAEIVLDLTVEKSIQQPVVIQ